ncbi:MAG: hypothetical protein WCP28_04115, partial [Actinomycetes bacterium]
EQRPTPRKHLPGTPPSPQELDGSSARTIRVVGGEGIPYRIAQCCRPARGTSVLARVLRDGTFNIHDTTCANIAGARNTVPAFWQ